MCHVYSWNETASLPNLSLVGGKARNLSILQKYNIPVPKWMAVTVKAFETLMQQRLAQIDALTADLKDMHAVKEIAERIAELIRSAVYPAALASELLAEIRETFGDDAHVAIRSSAVDEDSSEHSFAGQLDSFLFQRVQDGL